MFICYTAPRTAGNALLNISSENAKISNKPISVKSVPKVGLINYQEKFLDWCRKIVAFNVTSYNDTISPLISIIMYGLGFLEGLCPTFKALWLINKEYFKKKECHKIIDT